MQVKKYIFLTLTVLLTACSSNDQTVNEIEVEIEPIISVTEQREIDKDARKKALEAENEIYLENMAIRMKNYIVEEDYETAMNLYQEQILDVISVDPDDKTRELFNEARVKSATKNMEIYIAEGNYDGAISVYRSNFVLNTSIEADEKTYALLEEAVELGDAIMALVLSKGNGTNNNKQENSADPRAVHEYMQKQFDIITNYGESYVPEIHDPLVTQKVADAFNLTYEEAERLDYIGSGY